MTDEKTLACNREPFKTDSSCDRGDVDVTAFIDFPLCKLIDPTPPDAAIPQVDFPVIPFAPPPCSCVDIDFNAKEKSIEDRPDIYLEFDFQAIGDCCDGNYKTDIDLRVPCIPFDIKDPGEKGVTINSSCGIEPSGKFTLGLEKKACTISFDPKLELNIPQPHEVELEDGTVTIAEAECTVEPEGTLTFEETTKGDCTTVYTPKLELTLPKPPEVNVCTGEKTITMSGDITGEGKIKLADEASGCSIDICPEVELSIDCPLTADRATIKGSVDWRFGQQEKTATAQTLVEVTNCDVSCEDVSLDLTLPCPFNFLESDPPQITLKYGYEGSPKTTKFAILNREGCEISVQAPEVDLTIPDPPAPPAPSKISIIGISPIKVESDEAGTNFKISYTGGGGGGGSDSSSDSSSDSGSGGGGHTASLTAVTSVECSEDGGLNVESTTFIIDFDNKTVTQKRALPADALSVNKDLTRQLFASAVKAIYDDPSLLTIVDDPKSEAAERAFNKLGLNESGIAFRREDDLSLDTI